METNFKVDMPSFALGYSAGKKKGGGGGVELNIAYGDTPPEDTTMLWCKTTKPSRVVVAEPVHVSDVPTESSVQNSIKKQHAIGTKVGTKIYRIGGCSSAGSAVAGATVFDVETRTFERLPEPTDYDLYYATYAAGGVSAVGTKIYKFGGSSWFANASSFYNSGPIVIYDTETQTWRKLETGFGSQMSSMACEAVETKIYLFGGYDGSSNKNSIYRFDTETEELTKLGATISAAYSIGSAAIGSKIYLFGGRTGAYSVRTSSYCFDTETETMVAIKALPAATSGIGCCEMNGLIYLFGGQSVQEINEVNKIYIYDPESNAYEIPDYTLPATMSTLVCGAVGDSIYLVGGSYTSTGFEVRRYTPDPQLDKDALQICPKDGKAKVKVANTEPFTLEVPVAKVLKGNDRNQGETVETARHNGTKWVTI